MDDYQANLPSSPVDGSNDQQQRALPYLSFPLQRGDILQVLSRDSQFFQVRKSIAKLMASKCFRPEK